MIKIQKMQIKTKLKIVIPHLRMISLEKQYYNNIKINNLQSQLIFKK